MNDVVLERKVAEAVDMSEAPARGPLTEAEAFALYHPFDGLIDLVRKVEKAHGIGGDPAAPEFTDEARQELSNHVVIVAQQYAQAAVGCWVAEDKKGPMDRWQERDRAVGEARMRKSAAWNRLIDVVRDSIVRTHGTTPARGALK